MQLPDIKNTRPAYIISILTLLALLAGSLVWYKQRMLFVDPCWLTYKNINQQTIHIAEHRYGAFITQMVPLIGSKTGLSLRAILMAYSASFYVFYLAVALIAGYLRQYWLAILLACYFTFIVSDVYFWPNNEVHQGVVWMILFLALFLHYLEKDRYPVFIGLLFPVLMLLAIFSHFIVIIPFTFLWLYIILERRRTLTRRQVIVTGICSLCIVLLFIVKYKLGNSGWYDAGKLEPIKKMGLDTIVASFTTDHAKRMFPLFFQSYWILVLVLIAGLIALAVTKKYRQLLLLTGYVVGYFSLICLTYPGPWGKELLFYMESEWMALAVIAATPFVMEVLPRLKPAVVAGIVAGIFLVRLCYIGQAYTFFNDRYACLEKITERLHEQKISKAVMMLDEKRANELFIMDWGLPIESIMLSSLKNYDPQVTFKLLKDPEIRPLPADSFYSCFSIKPISEMDRRYYRLDTSSQYTVLQHSWLDSLLKK